MGFGKTTGRVWLVAWCAVLVAAFAAGCGSEEDAATPDTGGDRDVSADAISDVAPDSADDAAPDSADDAADTGGTANACGGEGALLYEGAPAVPGDDCGCGGVLVCRDGETVA